MTVRVSPIAPASLADTRARSRLGMAIAAMIPMIATTIRSSMSVNPFWVFKCVCPFTTAAAPTARSYGRDSRCSDQPAPSREPSARSGGGQPAPPSVTRSLQRGAGRRDEAARAVAAGHAVVGLADDAARVAPEAAHARLARDRRRRLVAEHVH